MSCRLSTLIPLILILAHSVRAQEALPLDHATRLARGQVLFTAQIRPLLLDRCVKCHGGDNMLSGLDLTTRAGLLKGGAHGPVLNLWKGKTSKLVRLVAHLEGPHMPKQGMKLTADQVALLAQWIDDGAAYDRPLIDKKSTDKKPLQVTAEDRQFWSFRPLKRPAPPTPHGLAWCRTPIDRFILTPLEAKGIAPNPVVDRRTLIRRASFDLTGLPPTPEQIEVFLNDRLPDAYERLIDQLLTAPGYGERWARHWLDLARFAESHGYEHDYDRPTAYHYRDFVIKALNQDVPYNTFVKWQIAGDELAPDNPLALTATGFLGAGVHSTQITANQVEKERYDELDDIVRTIGTSMLGLTIGCARCHDHKYDPIPTTDYYRLLSTFTTTVRTEYAIDFDSGEKKRQETTEWFPRSSKVKALICSEGLPAIRLHTQGGDFLPATYFLKRGDPNQKDGVATQSFLQVLMRTDDGPNRWLKTPPPGWRTSYRRLALADWITDVDQGAGHLLARVIVNRLWQHHFGVGLVATTSDFGVQGEKPSHPELLDWLACELIDHGWSLKHVHKLMMTSAVYMQGTQFDKKREAADPENKLHWRRVPRRLEAEVIRDAILAVSGTLDTRPFGPGTLDPNQKRRSIYFTVKRSQMVSMMTLFDGPDALQGVEQRVATTTAPQSLLMLNSTLVRSAAKALAERIKPLPGETQTDSVQRGFALTLGRQPSATELKESAEFIQEQMAAYNKEKKEHAAALALTDFCQALLGLNEFIYVD